MKDLCLELTKHTTNLNALYIDDLVKYIIDNNITSIEDLKDDATSNKEMVIENAKNRGKLIYKYTTYQMIINEEF
ncbi:MAG: hypothetical protein II309_00550 [Bacilli bacterium]|nr:hypothetical protein [Bacilli bacterium]